MEYILFFMFLPTILWAVTGKGKEKINKFAISTLEEIVESLPEESSKSKKPSCFLFFLSFVCLSFFLLYCLSFKF